jgi:16S rRNA G966 N2-methylase RsmD
MVYLLRPADPFQLIFADPPYRYPRTPDIPDLVFRAGALSTDGYLVIEHATDLRFEPTSEFAAGPEKKFGRTLVTFFRHRQQTTPTDPHA